MLLSAPMGLVKPPFSTSSVGNSSLRQGPSFFKGEDISGKPPHILNHLNLSRSFQITNVFQELSVFDNVRSGVRCRKGLCYNFFKKPDSSLEINEETADILDQIGLTDEKDIPARELSYGKQRALEIGITLSTQPELILLDEPTAGMTLEETAEAIKMIDKVTAGRSLIIIEHDMNVVFSLAQTISVLHFGTILVSGKPEDIRNDQRVKDAYLGEE